MKSVWQRKQTGFTIVELLIVIVVIAILAAITIVAYNGIQQQAKDSVIISTVDGWEKVLRMAAVNNNAMPLVGSCLGRPGDFPAKDGFPQGECVLVNGSSAGVAYNESDYATWSTVAKDARPSGEVPIVSYVTGGSEIRSRGVWIGSGNVASRFIEVRWLVQVNGECARGTLVDAPVVGSLNGGYCRIGITY